MNTLSNLLKSMAATRKMRWGLIIIGLVIVLSAATVVFADVLDRTPPRGTVPNPGTQQQELANITFPAPYNVFEFVVTCAGCHGGGIDQNAGHFSNWAGGSMASAARDPVFRANQIAVNNIIRDLTGENGAGNICMRCHSPNGWMSGRFDPTLAGDPEGRTMEHSILLSTDDEGILCEFCHRATGNVTFMREDLNPNDPAWNMLAGISDWPHAGGPYVDQAGTPSIVPGNPLGDATLQINDGMTYIGKYSGSVDIFTSDTPLPGTPYTGQTFGIYPPGWPLAGEPVINPDGSVPIHFEAPIGPPLNPDMTYNYQAQGLSLEHPTAGDRPGLGPQPVPEENSFLRSSEFCGSCHDLTVPVLNHGMPEQRTYTEWKYSDFGADNVRCQDCHMPTMMHEYADDAPVSLNPDPALAGWFPYAKDRNLQGGTAFHKFTGANRDLPMMMKELYPEVDLEVLGAPTGNDPRVFPGMLSNRDTMWDRAQRNSEIMLLNAVDVDITIEPELVMIQDVDPATGEPLFDPVTGEPIMVPDCDETTGLCKWQMKVQVTNTSGHRIPSGYPDGRRFWLDVKVSDGTDSLVYGSGYYDQAEAELLTAPGVPFNRALEPLIDTTGGQPNAVMVYERVTGTCKQNGKVTCEGSPNLLNDKILFDNRILPAGFDYAALREAGVKFWNYDADMVPYEDTDRYPSGQNWDEVTYRFDAPLGATLSARAEVYWQTHTREFMEHLRDQDTSTVRPEGPPSIFEINYPLTPNYLSDEIGLDTIVDPYKNKALKDNWGGIAYAAWLLTGKGAPYMVAVADTAAETPAQPTGLDFLGTSPYTLEVSWDEVLGADGYVLWVRYGASDATADWDKLAILDGATTSFVHDAVNVGKTFGYKVQAFNGAGLGPQTDPINAATATDAPLPPENLTAYWSGTNAVALSWFDTADNEIDFVVQRQNVPVVADFYDIAYVESQTPGGASGGNNLLDDGSIQTGVTWAAGYTVPLSGSTYNYRVAARNASGMSTWSLPVQALTTGVPGAVTNLVASTTDNITVDLAWNASTGVVDGYRVERSLNGTNFATLATVLPTATSYNDATAAQGVPYWYRVIAFNAASGDALPSNVVTLTLGTPAPANPTNLIGTWYYDAAAPNAVAVRLNWSDNATDESGYYIERSDAVNPAWVRIATIGAFAGTGVVEYIDNTVAPKNTYIYRVQAFRNDPTIIVTSAFSNEATVIIPLELPQAPSNLSVGRPRADSLRLTWTDNATNENGFYLERSLDGVNFSYAATISANTVEYTDTGLTRNTTYYYQIQAYNLVGVSEFSAIASGTTKKK